LLQQKTKTLSQQKTEILLQQKTKTLLQQNTVLYPIPLLLQKVRTEGRVFWRNIVSYICYDKNTEQMTVSHKFVIAKTPEHLFVTLCFSVSDGYKGHHHRIGENIIFGAIFVQRLL
jgi:hypothetical protein